MGAVYALRSSTINVAIKRVSKLLTLKFNSQTFWKSPPRDIKSFDTGSLRHPKIIRVLDYWFDSEQESLLHNWRMENGSHSCWTLARQIGCGKAGLTGTNTSRTDLSPSTWHLASWFETSALCLWPVMVVEKFWIWGLSAKKHPTQSNGNVGTMVIAPEVLREPTCQPRNRFNSVGVIAYELFGECDPSTTANRWPNREIPKKTTISAGTKQQLESVLIRGLVKGP